jgi:hypothetical protein
VDGEGADVVEDAEALAAGAADVVVDDELVDVVLQGGEVPPAAADLFEEVRPAAASRITSATSSGEYLGPR